MLGCDLVEIDRVRKLYEKFGEKVVKKILTDNEIKLFNQFNKNRKIEFLAGRFAAKESVIKSLNKQIVSFRDIEILRSDTGKPVVKVRDKVLDNLELSISHTKNYAMAISLLKE
ncbi:holo-[acyl-carrier-protein] synthase [Deferribacter autotrophicus]|uniref:Holo-[acyl-carrier-protein] synthase n=1 Tax=Deferribacter autotrophicus TaxID=500465 RepID=A0A5A8F3T4_9BACT|nr:holo-ACP synthase [Deferribacter autotrophicus]KAA0258186.1 holo-[acyl-carrier-protein] synthase [Deferribacter autotrophicus]